VVFNTNILHIEQLMTSMVGSLFHANFVGVQEGFALCLVICNAMQVAE
jgi:hypothetical protein